MPEKPGKNREQLKEITDRIEAGIRDIFESGDMEKYRNYLRTMSRFHNYSLNNQALIHLQRPDATLVAGYNRWRDKFSRHVLRGEKGITIIAPTPYKKKIEQEKLDPDTKLPILDADGKIVTEEKEIEIPMFRPVKVFDYAQTDGKPLPERNRSVYLMLHKPRGYVTTLSDERGRKDVARLVKDCPQRVYPIGRLDQDSELSLIHI